MSTLADHPLILDPPVLPAADLIGDLIQPGNPLFGLVWINAQRVSGEPCFYATRVPIRTLFHCLAAGQTMEEFLDDFDGVTREQAEAILSLAGSHLLNDLSV